MREWKDEEVRALVIPLMRAVGIDVKKFSPYSLEHPGISCRVMSGESNSSTAHAVRLSQKLGMMESHILLPVHTDAQKNQDESESDDDSEAVLPTPHSSERRRTGSV
ncbi:hypothetical protein BLNAU_17613 [Blattamonas nauphoetae]|uniref:Uncharacterized protein n=1 Tax=Blattamonas nauphoetae TaxID=2049346 RepID=A0ABQ9X776_9EUKA|nr:hypothetical protein BLNAU_17613 [Blattamonas nauphoetae]